jgi:FAD:protein FMN transferase
MPPIPATGPVYEHERRFELFGSHVRLLIGAPVRAGYPSPLVMSLQIEGFLRLLHRRLTRFEASSQLSRLNADPRRRVPVSSTVAVAVEAALWAARRSGGLVDPTLLGKLEDAGYRTSRVGVAPADLAAALDSSPRRGPAQPASDPRWPMVSVDLAERVVTRPAGVRIDTGGSGKGLAADLAADRLAGYSTFVVDAGGDLRIGGERPVPRLVRIDHPLEAGTAHEFMLDHGAVATSGIKTRIWRNGSGFAHHLIDPSTGEPAWTGVIQATAVGGSALEAETLAKMAFLAGPAAAPAILAEHGGVIVLDDGSVQLAGPLAARSVPAPEPAIAA